MISGWSIYKIYFLLLVTLLLSTSFVGNNNKDYARLAGVTNMITDTVVMDTTGPLPFPFKDQPAFGAPSPDSIKLFLNKPSNIKYEIEYDPVTG